MALGKQNISISFGKGVDTKTDNKQVVPGKLLNLENAVLKKVGKFVKRFGYGVINNGFPLSNGNALATFKNELVAFDGSTLYSYSQSDDRVYPKGTKTALDIATQSVARNSYEQTNPDCGYHAAGISLYAWEDSSGGVRVSIFDVYTNQTIVSNTLISATGSKPKVKVINDYIVLFFIDGTSLKYTYFDINTVTTVNPEVLLASGVSGYYDVSLFNSLMYVAYATGTTTCIFTLNSALVQSSTQTVSAASSCLGIFNDASNNVWIIYNEVNSVKYFIYDSSLSTPVLAPTTIETGTAPFVNVTGYVDGTMGYFFYEVSGDIPSNQYIKTSSGSVTGSVNTPYDFLRSVGLYSKIFENTNNEKFFTVTHQSDLQPTYFVVSVQGKVAAKIAPSLGGGLATTGLLAEVNEISTSKFLMAYEYKDFVQSVAGDVTTQTGVNGVNLTFNGAITSAEIGNNLHSSGAVITAYDSQNTNELGFHLYPEEINITYESIGGTLPAGTYGYAATYEWTDAQGQIHRSAPFYKNVEIANDQTYFTALAVYAIPSQPKYWFRFWNNPSNPSDNSGNVEDSMQNIYPGKKINIPNYGTTYVTEINDYRYSGSDIVYVNVVNPSTSTAFGNKTATGYPETGYNASTVIGDDDIYFNSFNFTSYVGNVTSGSNIIYMPKTAGLCVGMRLISAGNTFPIISNQIPVNRITAVNDDNIVLNINASSSGTKKIFHFVYPLYGTGFVSSFTYNSNTYGPLKYFIGQNVYNIQAGTDSASTYIWTTITNIVDAGGGLYTITTANVLNFNDPNNFFVVGIYPTKDFFETQSITSSANFNNPLTVTNNNAVVGSISPQKITVDKSSFGTGNTFVNVSSYASPALSVDTLRITDKENVVINIYRTINNGTVYYQVANINGILNDKTVNNINFVDALSDEVLIGNQQLYTTGGEVENIAPPAGDVVGTYKNRLLVVPNEDPISFWYSKQVRANTPIEFNDSFVQRVPEKGGPITAFQQMDDKLLIFKQDYIFVMVGDGPSVSGVNNDFTDPQLITADAGCVDKKSVVVLPTGVIYKSQKGFYLLDRALNVKYIGADVESFNSYSVTSAKMNETENQQKHSNICPFQTLRRSVNFF